MRHFLYYVYLSFLYVYVVIYFLMVLMPQSCHFECYDCPYTTNNYQVYYYLLFYLLLILFLATVICNEFSS